MAGDGLRLFALDVDMLEEVDGDRLRAELSELDREGEGEAECDRNDFFFFFFLSGGDETVELTPPLAVVDTVSRRLDAPPTDVGFRCTDSAVVEVLLLTLGSSSSCSVDGYRCASKWLWPVVREYDLKWD